LNPFVADTDGPSTRAEAELTNDDDDEGKDDDKDAGD